MADTTVTKKTVYRVHGVTAGRLQGRIQGDRGKHLVFPYPRRDCTCFKQIVSLISCTMAQDCRAVRTLRSLSVEITF